MVDALALELVEKHLVADQLALTVNYDVESLSDPAVRSRYKGEVIKDWYGRPAPKHAHGSENFGCFTSSSKMFLSAADRLYDRIVHPDLLIRRMNVVAVNTIPEEEAARKAKEEQYEQMDLFTDYAALEQKKEQEKAEREKERRVQEAVLEIRKKFGKNAMLKGMNLVEGATAAERNEMVGGHQA
ncbi:MAG: DNA methylase, partial [Parasporobacterium sp.]|nr:DNA methylase [Parasporobacterium sp.]